MKPTRCTLLLSTFISTSPHVSDNYVPIIRRTYCIYATLVIFTLYGRRGGCIGSWWGNRREGDHWEDLGVDGRIILGWISRRWDVGIWTGLGWPTIERGGGRL